MWSRMKGLLGRRSLDEGTGLLIDPCTSIHMFFMRFPIDVVYLNKEYVVVKSAHVPAWRLSSGGRGAKKAIELPAGHAVEYNVRVGERLTLAPFE